MKIKPALLFLLIFCLSANAQQGFQLEKDKKKVTIPFQLINNLIIIPINVNGEKLNFLLDSGVEETILLSLDDKEAVSLNNIEKIKLRGLGSNESIEGLKSTNNILSVGELIDRHHDLYIVLDQSFNFSSHLGIPVNGIIGYHFFKNNLIEINYDRQKITIYNDTKKIRKKINKNYATIPISIEKNKPYAHAIVTMDDKIIPAKLLVDLGNSDALWLFQDVDKQIRVPLKNFDDFLGMGFSGNVMGKRAKIEKFSIDKFEFNNPIIAMPDSNSVKSVNMVTDRVGSIGGEVFKRFSVILDYKNNQMFLRKGSHYDMPFQYNMGGIELQNEGMQWVSETVELQTVLKGNTFDENGNKTDFKYKFSLKPIYTIANIRKNSPAELCGLRKGDVIITINRYPAYKYSLQGINEILKSEEGKWLYFEIERNSQLMNFKLQLKSIL
jgi:hypothetical protein